MHCFGGVVNLPLLFGSRRQAFGHTRIRKDTGIEVTGESCKQLLILFGKFIPIHHVVVLGKGRDGLDKLVGVFNVTVMGSRPLHVLSCLVQLLDALLCCLLKLFPPNRRIKDRRMMSVGDGDTGMLVVAINIFVSLFVVFIGDKLIHLLVGLQSSGKLVFVEALASGLNNFQAIIVFS